MSNRYSKTGFTAREVKKLKKLIDELAVVYNNRLGKQDSDQSLRRLLVAREHIQQSLFLAEKWKNE